MSETVNLEDLAKAKIPEVAATFPEMMKRFRLLHRKDLAGYAFACRRFGDFLTLEVTRGEAFVTTINLGLVRTITLTEGHGPDRLGVVRFDSYQMSASGGYCSSGNTVNPIEASASAGWRWEVRPALPYCPDRQAAPADMGRIWSAMIDAALSEDGK
jgi:hypothetical protein